MKLKWIYGHNYERGSDTERRKNRGTFAVFSHKMAFLKSKFKDDPVRVQRHTVPHFKDLE